MSAAGRLSKPVLRGNLLTKVKRDMAIALTLAVSASMAWKFFVADPRKKRYADFYRDYDPEAEWEKMKATGSLPPFPVFDKDE